MGRKQLIYTEFAPKLRLFFVAAALLLAGIILVVSLIPARPGASITHMDKLMHVLAYLLLGGAALPAFPRVKPLLVWFGVSGFGVLIEVLQGLMSTGRSTDLLDGFANATGALLALFFWVVLSRLVRLPTLSGE